jgi:hypothetical protein
MPESMWFQVFAAGAANALTDMRIARGAACALRRRPKVADPGTDLVRAGAHLLGDGRKGLGGQPIGRPRDTDGGHDGVVSVADRSGDRVQAAMDWKREVVVPY